MIRLLLFVLLMTACSSIDSSVRPPDWPELRVVVHQDGFMAKHECNGTLGGCAVPNFCAKRCDIYLQFDSRTIEAHERAHCEGFDHPGDDTMRSAWANYKRMDGPRFCALQMGLTNYCTLHDDKELCG